MSQLVAVPVWDALVARVVTAPNPPAMLNAERIYRDGEVPEQAADALADSANGRGYIIIGTTVEPRGGFYNGQTGRTGILCRLHCWGNTPTNAARIAAWLTDVLDGVMLTLDDHTMWTSQITSLGHIADTDRTAFQVPLNWEVSTLEAA